MMQRTACQPGEMPSSMPYMPAASKSDSTVTRDVVDADAKARGPHLVTKHEAGAQRAAAEDAGVGCDAVAALSGAEVGEQLPRAVLDLAGGAAVAQGDGGASPCSVAILGRRRRMLRSSSS